MKTITRFLLAVVLPVLLLGGCSYDDSALWDEVNGLKEDIESLQSSINSMNTDIGSLKTLVDALNENDFVSSVADNPGGGYTITFGSGKTVTIKDGQDGADAPVIGVKSEDGVYYWTVTSGGKTEWLTDSDGDKLPVSGPQGETGTTPVIGVDSEGYWTVDTGSGAVRITDVDGNPVKAVGDKGDKGDQGEKGDQGDSFFQSVQVDETAGTVTFILNDGDNTVFVLPLVKNFVFDVDMQGGTEFNDGRSRAYPVTAVGVKSFVITKPDGWRVSLDDEMTALTVTAPAGNPYAESEGTVAVVVFNNENFARMVSFDVVLGDYVVFDDPEFEAALLSKYPDLFDTEGKVSLATAAAVTTISINGPSVTNRGNITSLEGIQCFTGLTHLSCNYNQLEALDLSQNPALIYLNCNYNQLGTLDVSQNTALRELHCFSNLLTTLDVSANTALKVLHCYTNQLSTLDVSQNTALTSLYCLNNQLTTLDVSANTALITLYCYNNQLTTLDVSANTALTNLQCYSNRLTTLDVSANTALLRLECYSNRLTTLDVSANTALTYLYCYSNRLTTLDVSANTALKELRCMSNQLTTLDISANTALTLLYCGSNQLTTLDVSANTALTLLTCYSNQFTTLDVSANTALTTLICYSSQLTTLDVSANTALINLTCYSSQLTTLDVSGCTKLAEANSLFRMQSQDIAEGAKTSVSMWSGFDPATTPTDKWIYDADKVDWIIP